MSPRPERTLRALADLANHLAVTWPTYQATEAALAAPTTRAANQPSGSGGDTPDPVHTIAATHLRYWGTIDNLADALTILRAAQRTVESVRRHHSQLAAEHDTATKALRCSGAVDATCTRHAVRDGLCWGCYQARRRYGIAEAQRRKQG